MLSVVVSRVRWPSEVQVTTLEKLHDGIGYLRLVSFLSFDALDPTELRSLLVTAIKFRDLIIDLRNCRGGDLKNSLPLLSSLLEPNRSVETIVPRETGTSFPTEIYSASDPDSISIGQLVKQQNRVLVQTYEEPSRLDMPLALLVNNQTESEPEMVAAALKEHGRARLFGAPTAGHTNGWTLGLGLPYEVGYYSIPYTAHLSPNGHNYEGLGVAPHEEAQNTTADFLAGRDRVVDAALGFLLTEVKSGFLAEP